MLISEGAYCIIGTELLAVLIQKLIHFAFTECQNVIIYKSSFNTFRGSSHPGGLITNWMLLSLLMLGGGGEARVLVGL